jgi:phosphoribosylaminoimidazole (AIR) synthetase
VIDNANIKAGDVIVGLASFGSQPMRKVIMAVWEATDLHLHVMKFWRTKNKDTDNFLCHGSMYVP